MFEVIDSNAGSATSYTDRSVSPEDSYVYRVKAVSPTGVSQWSSYARADIPVDPEALAPSGLSAKVVSGDDGVIEGVALAWNAPAADAESVTGYEILRAVGDGDLATLVADTGSAGTTYADDTATEAGESYAYRVKALRGEEASQPSDRAVAFIPKVTTVDPQPGIAEEQNVAVWSATLSVKTVSPGILGCHNSVSAALCSASLIDTTFSYDNTSYTVEHFFLRAAGTLELNVTTIPTDATIAELTLNIGDTAFALSAAFVSGSEIAWSNSGLTWTADTDVTVTLTHGSAAPVVSSVEVTSEPGGDDTYAIGDTIQVTVTFDQAVTVTGAPRIKLRVGGGDAVHQKWADYTSGSGNEALLFAYTVQADDFDDNGIYIAANELELNGGTIQSSDGTDANLEYPLQGGQSGHNVDGVLPTPQSAATSVDGSSVIIIFSEPLSETTAPASAFAVSVDTGTAPAVSTAAATGDTVTLGLASALTGDQVVTVTYNDATAGNDAVNFTQTVANAVGTGCSIVDGCHVVPADWGLIPTGLGAGDRFRLVFLSSTTRNAQSTNIADYNTFVQTAAAAGHADIQQYSSTFRVVGSTAAVDARDNTATRYTGDDTAATDDDSDLGVAIYWLGGNKVADEYKDFYDEDWDDEANAKDESGNNRSTSLDTERPLTGSDHNGTEALSTTNTSRALGASNVRTGSPNSSTSGYGPLGSNFATPNSNTHPLYGLSPVFRVSGGQVVTNTAPAFTTGAEFSTNENQAATFQVTAMDADAGDEVTYAITGGADRELFSINATSGLLAIPVSVDHENPADADGNNTYLVTVTATGGTGARALTTDQAITVTVNDVDEPPSAPATPTVSAVSGSSDSLSVTWTAPDNSGKPDIDSYDLQYRKGTTGNFADGPQDVTVTSAIIGGLDADSLYQVQVRATNEDGDGAWSSRGTGTTNASAGCGTLPAGRLWSACLTVGEISSVGRYGYQSTTATGSLVPATFDIGTTTYTVVHLFDDDISSAYVQINLAPAISEDDAGNLTLHLGDDTSLSFADATYTTPTGASAHRWPRTTALGWSEGDEIEVGITQKANTAPSFLMESSTREVAENSAAGVDVGGPVIATDTDTGDTLTYTLEGTDAASFGIVSTSGQIQTKTGVTYDHELQPEYSVTVKADDGNGGTDTIAVTIDIADEDEPPSAPAAPTVLASPGESDSLEVTWTAPDNSGKPDIESYDLQYRKGTTGTWIDGPQDETGLTATIDGLDEDSAYEVQVRATNDEGDSVWSSAGSGSTNAPAKQMAETTAWVSNTAQTLASIFFNIGHLDKRHSQGFSTGAELGGYSLGSVGVYVQDEDLESGETFTVHIYTADTTGAIDTLVYTLISPDSYEDGAVNLFTAPADATLAADTDYLVVFEATGDEGEDFILGYTNSTSEDSGSATGWSIEDERRFDNGTFSGVFVISVNAPPEELPETTVPADWSLIPTGLGPGDRFRLIFISTSNSNANSSDIDVYNTFVQNLVAASGHEAIKALSATFRMLGSTEAVDARDNTGTTGAGVPIYWLGGAKVADDYGDFYDGDWDEEATGRRENGDSVSIGNNWKIWTGSAEDGTEAMNDTNTESRALGNSGNHWVMQGSPNGSDSAHGPIQSNTAGRGTNRGVYGLSGVFTVSDQPTANDPPAFSSAASFSVEENQTDAGTVIAADPDAVDAVTYAVTGGADRAKFDIGESSGDLTFKDAPDHENPTDAGRNNTYMVTVTATGGTGDRAMTAEQTITVTVTDVAETPAVDDLDVSSTPKADIDTYGREETIEVTVTFDQAVNVTGTPRIRLRIGGGMQQHYRWADYDGGTGTTALRFTYVVVEGDMDTDGIYILENELELNGGAIQGVDDDVAADLDYPRQGTQSGHKVDGSLKSDNTDPAFDQESAVRGLRENTGAGEYVGDPFTATDEDGDTLTYSLEGDDAGSFAINSRTGQILTREGVTYDHEVTTEYSVRVKADDGERGDATVEVAILVIDVNEPPLAPRAPTLSDGPDDSGSLDVTWKTPDNSGRPDIESYDLRYRKSGAENWRNGPQHVTGTSAAITGLDADSDYQVQVRATNDEGDGEWSPSRSTTYPTGPVIEVDDNGDGVVDADPEVTLVLGSTVSYRVRPGRCEGYKTLTVQRMSGASEGAPPHIPVDASQEVSPMPCMGEDDPGEWQTVTLAVPLDLWLELLLETRFEASVEHSVYYRRSLTDRYSPLLLWGHLVRVLAPAPETLNPVGSLTVEPDARDYPRVTWSAVPGATGYQVQWRWGPDEEYGRVHRQEGSTYSREKRTGETAYTIPISETVPTTDEGVERSQPITVRVRPYDSKGLAVGPWREALLAERTEVRKVLASFSLLDADGSSLAALTDGATVELSDPDGGSYAIRAELVAGELAGSVHLELSGKKRVRSTENDAPYLLAGGEGMALPAGSYTLEATAYGGPDRTYAVQHTLEVSFTVTAAASGQPGSGELNVEEDEEEETEPLTARFEGLPEAGHGGGGTPFAFQLVFSEAVSTTPEALRDHALAVTNATVEAASRVDGRSDLWEVRLTPESDAMVTVSLSPLAGCDAAGAVCTEDGRMLSVGAARVILGPPPNSPATGQPTISGTAQVGQTLTADTSGIADEDGLDNVTFSYQWMADDTNIQGATGSTYTLADRDEGKAIKVIVSFTDDANNEESLPSAATDAVTALPGKPQSLAGKATTQEIQLAWKAPTGPAVVEYVVYRGILQNGSMNGQALSKYATIDAAGKAMTYTDGNVEEGVEYRYRVAAVNADGEGKKSTWLDITAE